MKLLRGLVKFSDQIIKMIMWFDVLFWLYSAQIVLCFSVSDNHGQTSDVILLSHNGF